MSSFLSILLVLIAIVTLLAIIRIHLAKGDIILLKKFPFIFGYKTSDTKKSKKGKIISGRKLIIGLVSLILIIITIAIIDTIRQLYQNVTPHVVSNDSINNNNSDTTRIDEGPLKILLYLDQHGPIQAQQIFDKKYKGKIVEWKGKVKNIESVGLFTPRSSDNKIYLYFSDSGLCFNPAWYIVTLRHNDGAIFLAECREEYKGQIKMLNEGELLTVQGEIYEWTLRERIKLINCVSTDRVLLFYK